MLVPGGVLLLTGPAHMSLWSYFDVASHHCRRYEPDELVRKLVGAGYRVEYVTQYMASLYPLVWLGRWLVGRGNRHDAKTMERRRNLLFRELRIVPLVNDLLAWLLSREVPVIARRRKIALGTSLLAIARKDERPGS
jgi:hypothetical protein